MVVDGGTAGLAQSQHHPNAGKSIGAGPATLSRSAGAQEGLKEAVFELKKQLADLVIPNKVDEAFAIVAKIIDACVASENGRESRSLDAPATVRDLKEAVKSIEKTIDKRITSAKTQKPTDHTNAKTWAQMAAAQCGSGGGAWEPKLVVPPRHGREVIIRAAGIHEEYATRTAVDTVKAVNTALGIDEAIAARRLRSGDVVVTFKAEGGRYQTDKGWVNAAFGTAAERSSRVYTIVAKGIPNRELKIAHTNPDELLKELRDHNAPTINKIIPKFPKNNNDAKFATIILNISDIDAAKQLCNNGLIWRAQIFDCEPFSKEVVVRLCYKCYKYGHIAKHCLEGPRCGSCAGVAHQNGERECPSKKDAKYKKCVNCGGNHVTWDSNCPVAKAQRDRARDAYVYRPKQFEVRSSPGNASSARLSRAGAAHEASIAQKRKSTSPIEETPKRGRPRNQSQPHPQPRTESRGIRDIGDYLMNTAFTVGQQRQSGGDNDQNSENRTAAPNQTAPWG